MLRAFRHPFALALLLVSTFVTLRDAAAASDWRAAVRHDGIVYFLFASPASIERFDMRAGSWLPPIALPAIPRAMAVDEDGLFVAFEYQVSRFTLDGLGETPLFTTPFPLREIVTSASRVIAVGFATIVTADKTSGLPLQTGSPFYHVQGVSFARSRSTLYGRSTGISPADVVRIPISASGAVGDSLDSPYHGAFPGASRTWLTPNESRVIDDAGLVYNAADLSYAHSLAGTFDALAFHGELPIVLRGSTLYAYDAAYREAGRLVVGGAPREIGVEGGVVFLFGEGASVRPTVASVPVSTIAPLVPGAPVDPNGLAYTPEAVHLGTDGVIYLLSRAHQSVFRWALATRAYLPTIPLAEAPSYGAYSDVLHRYYLAYPGGRITQIQLGSGITETPFANLPQSAYGIVAAGAFLFATDPSGAWASHYTFAADGSAISAVEWNYLSPELVWSDVRRRVYFFRDQSPSDLHSEPIDQLGRIGPDNETPYHGFDGLRLPIRVAPDGSVVLLGSGWIFDAETLEHIDTLPTTVTDAAWDGGELVTIRPAGANTELLAWTAAYAVESTTLVAGTPLRVFDTRDGLLVITLRDGVPTFATPTPGAGDFDTDGVPDGVDVCITVADPSQADRDGDGVGDACNDEADADGDEWADARDKCPQLADPGQPDRDGDGLGDGCDPFPQAADHFRAQCELDRSDLVAARFELELWQNDPRLADADGDGETDARDLCPGTRSGDPVDSAGCSRAQFCAASVVGKGLASAAVCTRADWRNDEPLLGATADCAWRRPVSRAPWQCQAR